MENKELKEQELQEVSGGQDFLAAEKKHPGARLFGIRQWFGKLLTGDRLRTDLRDKSTIRDQMVGGSAKMKIRKETELVKED